MDIDLVVWLVVLLGVSGGWILMAGEWGVVERVDEMGFTLRTVLRTRRVILWHSLQPTVREFSSFLPRVIVYSRDTRFFNIHTSFAILLRGRALDHEFVRDVHRRFTVAEA